MIKHFYGPKKRRKFDMDADWLPQKNRSFVLKGSVAPPQEPAQPAAPTPQAPTPQATKPTTKSKTTDAQGLKTAYKAYSGFYRDAGRTLHMAGTRGSFVGEGWMENYKVYGPSLLNTLKE